MAKYVRHAPLVHQFDNLTRIGDTMNPLTKFYIQAPQDEYWNTGYPTTIIEAEEDEKNADKPSFSHSIKVIVPSFFAQSWSSVSKRSFIECSGPARKLTYEEYVDLVHRLIPNHPLPN